jgi:hypothetical protein
MASRISLFTLIKRAVYKLFGKYTTPFVVLIGVPNKKSFEKVLTKLEDNHIEYAQFFEPDNDMGLSAIATVPL